MAKLYVIGIGGTGARVMRSFLYLLSGGYQLGNRFSSVVPLLIDPDLSNGNLLQCYELVKSYKNFYDMSSQSYRSKFFMTRIEYLGELAIPGEQKQLSNKSITLSSIQELLKSRSFKDVISYPNLSEKDKSFLRLFFNQHHLSFRLDKGFLGNPNIGSVIAEKIDESEEIDYLTKTFTQGDRIFLISSIFGGTGAAIFPVLLKKFRRESNNQALREAIIGAITYLPYFNLEQNSSSYIDSHNFMPKAKAALSYYEDKVSNELNAHYFLGDKVKPNYKNNDGGEAQKNNAHFLEFLGAAAIAEFCSINDEELKTTRFFEFALDDFHEKIDENTAITFKHFKDSAKIGAAYFRLILAHKLLNMILNDERVYKPLKEQNKLETDNHLYVKELANFLEDYSKFLKEMYEVPRKFYPFSINGSLYHIVNGSTPRYYEKKIFGIWTKKIHLNENYVKNKLMSEYPNKIYNTQTMLDALSFLADDIHKTFFSRCISY